MLEKPFVTRKEWKQHTGAPWRTVHAIWDHIKDYVPGWGYSKAEIDAMWEGYDGGKGQVDWDRVVNKPATFPPDAHAAEHEVGGGDLLAFADITGFGDYLDQAVKAASSPTFAEVIITSDILMTGAGAGKNIKFQGTHGGGGEGITYEDAGGTGRFGLIFPGSDVVALVNRASNGIVEIRANAAGAGEGGEVTVATFEDDLITFAVVVSGEPPTIDAHLATKKYVDDQIGGVNEFIELTDTPGAYAGEAGKFVKVNATPDALEFASLVKADITDTPWLSTDVEVLKLVGATYEDIQDFINTTMSAGRISGGEISDDGDGTVTIAAGTGFIKASDTSSIEETYFFDWAQDTTLVLINNAVNYIYIEYNAGTPRVQTTVTRSDIRLTDMFTLGRVYKENNTLHIVNTGVNLDIHIRREHERLVACRWIENASGGLVSEPAALKLKTTAGIFYVGLDKIETPEVDTSVAGTFTALYRDGGGGWTKELLQTDVNIEKYDDGSGVLANIPANKYSARYVYIDFDGHVYVQYGQAGDKLGDIQAELVPATSNFLNSFAILAARIIVKDGTSPLIEIAGAYEDIFQYKGITDHDDLNGVTSDQHHPQLHAASHADGQGDELSHDALKDYVAKQHRAWEDSIVQNIHDDTIPSSAITQNEGDIDHNALANYVAAEHYDWTNETHDFLTSGTLGAGNATLGTIGCNEITIADDHGLNLQEDISFLGATTENQIKFPDNLADALSFKEGANFYQTFITTNGSEAIQFHKNIGVGASGGVFPAGGTAKIHAAVASGAINLYITTDADDEVAALWLAHDYDDAVSWGGMGLTVDGSLKFSTTGSFVTAGLSVSGDDVVITGALGCGTITTTGDYLLADGNYVGISGAERLEFYTAGYAAFMGCNVGMNINNPDTHLTIYGHYAQVKLLSDSVEGMYIVFVNSDLTSTGYLGMESSAGGTIWPGTTGNSLCLGTGNVKNIHLFTNSIVRVTVDSIGNIGIGLIPTVNMPGLSIEAGLLTLKERATPTADVAYGKIYTKDDNLLYFQSGDGVEHRIAYV